MAQLGDVAPARRRGPAEGLAQPLRDELELRLVAQRDASPTAVSVATSTFTTFPRAQSAPRCFAGSLAPGACAPTVATRVKSDGGRCGWGCARGTAPQATRTPSCSCTAGSGTLATKHCGRYLNRVALHATSGKEPLLIRGAAPLPIPTHPPSRFSALAPPLPPGASAIAGRPACVDILTTR